MAHSAAYSLRFSPRRTSGGLLEDGMPVAGVLVCPLGRPGPGFEGFGGLADVPGAGSGDENPGGPGRG